MIDKLKNILTNPVFYYVICFIGFACFFYAYNNSYGIMEAITAVITVLSYCAGYFLYWFPKK